MVLGNLGCSPASSRGSSSAGSRAAFVDGAEWVMAPNAAGMALFADGGEMMTKPYAAGGSYVNRMSRFCGDCRYYPNERTGEDACPVTRSTGTSSAATRRGCARTGACRWRCAPTARFDEVGERDSSPCGRAPPGAS